MEARAEYPSVFVVDGPQRNLPFLPPVRRRRKMWSCSQLFLGILMLLMLTGFGIQGYFLICFRKELDHMTAQGKVETTQEKLLQGHIPATNKPAAHLTGASFNAAGNSTLQWDLKQDSTLLQDMDYKGGSLICNKAGHYYIYSKLSLGNSTCPNTQQKNMLVTHTIYKKTSQYRVVIPLLTNIISYCNGKGTTFWWHNSFLAGVVKLHENEEVYIQVSERRLVRVKDGTRSYFGTFMI